MRILPCQTPIQAISSFWLVGNVTIVLQLLQAAEGASCGRYQQEGVRPSGCRASAGSCGSRTWPTPCCACSPPAAFPASLAGSPAPSSTTLPARCELRFDAWACACAHAWLSWVLLMDQGSCTARTSHFHAWQTAMTGLEVIIASTLKIFLTCVSIMFSQDGLKIALPQRKSIPTSF